MMKNHQAVLPMEEYLQLVETNRKAEENEAKNLKAIQEFVIFTAQNPLLISKMQASGAIRTEHFEFQFSRNSHAKLIMNLVEIKKDE